VLDEVTAVPTGVVRAIVAFAPVVFRATVPAYPAPGPVTIRTVHPARL